MRFRVLLAVALLSLAGPAAAHPLTDIRFDRTAAVRVSTEGVEVKYTLEVGALAMTIDSGQRLTPAEIARIDKTAVGLARVYAKNVANELVEQFRVTSDGQRLPL